MYFLYIYLFIYLFIVGTQPGYTMSSAGWVCNVKCREKRNQWKHSEGGQVKHAAYNVVE